MSDDLKKLTPYRDEPQYDEGTFEWGERKIERTKLTEWLGTEGTGHSYVFSKTAGMLEVHKKENTLSTVFEFEFKDPESISGKRIGFDKGGSPADEEWLKSRFGISMTGLLKSLVARPGYKERKKITDIRGRQKTLKDILDDVPEEKNRRVRKEVTGITKNGVCTIEYTQTGFNGVHPETRFAVYLINKGVTFFLDKDLSRILEMHNANKRRAESKIPAEKMTDPGELLDETLETFTTTVEPDHDFPETGQPVPKEKGRIRSMIGKIIPW